MHRPAYLAWPTPDLSSIEDRWLAMTLWQNGRCAVCGEVDDLVTDHDHSTGLIRGFLCQDCNQAEGLGYAKPEREVSDEELQQAASAVYFPWPPNHKAP